MPSSSARGGLQTASVSPVETRGESPWCLRWDGGRQSWRHVSQGGFDPARYVVHAVDEATAKRFVVAQHYARSFPAARHRFGLFDTRDGADRLVGVAVYGIPVQRAVLAIAFPTLEPYVESVELSRFVLRDECPGNSESWFLARTFEQLHARDVRGVVSFADPMPRQGLDGAWLTPGHVGTIYQASNALYTGRGTARTLTLLPDGTVLNDRAAQKVRSGDQGHAYVEARLAALGARPLSGGEDPAVWLREALRQVGARRVRHRGAHRYLFRLGGTRRERERIPVGLPAHAAYPKQPDALP